MADTAGALEHGAAGDEAAGEEDGPARDRILAAALAEFARNGFEGTTTAVIARHAGVTQPLVNYHFSSKDELWRAAVRSQLDALEAGFAGSLKELSDLDSASKLKVLLRRWVHFSAEHPELGRVLSQEGATGSPRLTWLLSQAGRAQLGLLVDLLDQAAAEGTVKPLPMAHVASCLAAAAAYVFVIPATMLEAHGIDVTDPQVIDRHADTVVEMCFGGLLTGEGAA